MESKQQQHQQPTRPVTSIDLLNDDILVRIFDYLHFDDKIRLRRTCYRWKLLLDQQIERVKALRIGQFQQGGYHITSGLNLDCGHQVSNHRQHTGTLFNDLCLNLPAELETQCYSINRYDYLHRSLKHCHKSITMLSLGRLNVSYRLLIVLTHNLPYLEHLELIGCASEIRKKAFGDNSSNLAQQAKKRDKESYLPSVESFNNQRQQQLPATYSTIVLYNQHQDEQLNIEERLLRANLVKGCDLVRDSKAYWPNLRHLLVKECNLLNEFSLCLILAITSKTLNYLAVESNQYLTGEFLNYCGPKLNVLKLRYCPMLQTKFLEDLVKIKQLLAPSSCDSNNSNKQINLLSQSQSSNTPQPINSFMLRNLRNFKQDIYCTL